MVYPSSAREFFSTGQQDADSLYRLADSLLNKREYEASDEFFKQAQEIYAMENNMCYFISCLIKRARVTYNLGYSQEAWEILSRIEEAFNRYNISRYDTLYSNFLNRKGYFLLMQNELNRARDCYLESARIRENLEIIDYPLSYAYSNLGHIYNQTGDITQAEQYFRKTLEIRGKILKPGDPRLAFPLSNLGVILITLARYDEAEHVLDNAKDIYIQKYEENHHELGPVYNNMGIIYSTKGDYLKALSYFEMAIQLSIKIPGTYKNVIINAYNNLGSTCRKMKNYTKIIDRYLDGDLNGSELKALEKELDSNPELKEELKLQREINAALREKEVLDLRAQLKVIHRSLEPVPERNMARKLVHSKWTRIAAASVVLLIAIAALTGNFTGKRMNYDKIFNKYYETYKPLNVRSGFGEIDKMYRNALTAYQKENYEKALVLFEEVLEIDQSRIEANLMTGVSNMELDEYEEASSSFSKIINHNDNLFIEHAEWYIGFCYIRTDNTDKAIRHFTKIASGNSLKKNKAKRILRKIK
ncbi:Photosystem I assembly protein Ycf3 [subsurface metagenome]